MSAPTQHIPARNIRFIFGNWGRAMSPWGFDKVIGPEQMAIAEAVTAPRNRYEPDDAAQFEVIAQRTKAEEASTW